MRHSNIGRVFSACAALTLSVTLLASASLQPASAEQKGGNAAVSSTVLIKAPPVMVWNAIRQERFNSPDLAYSKVLQRSGNESTVEQKFTGIPFLGSVIAVTKQVEDPMRSVSYNLISSDRFKVFDGAWQLTPADGGKATRLSLSSTLDIGVPFSGMFIRGATLKKVNSRLNSVKRMAEADQRLAERARPL